MPICFCSFFCELYRNNWLLWQTFTKYNEYEWEKHTKENYVVTCVLTFQQWYNLALIWHADSCHEYSIRWSRNKNQGPSISNIHCNIHTWGNFSVLLFSIWFVATRSGLLISNPHQWVPYSPMAHGHELHGLEDCRGPSTATTIPSTQVS